jgi:hypothetical protein
LPSSKNKKTWKAGQNDRLKEYLFNEWKYNVLKKFLKYFDEWYENITDNQRMYFEAYMNGKKTPF